MSWFAQIASGLAAFFMSLIGFFHPPLLIVPTEPPSALGAIPARDISSNSPMLSPIVPVEPNPDSGSIFSQSVSSASPSVNARMVGLFYKIDGDRVWYEDFFKGYVSIGGADAATFTLIQEPPRKNCSIGLYAKDKSTVYAGNRIVPNNPDPQTFRVIALPYTRDAMHVYANDVVVAGADPDTFSVFEQNATDTCAGKEFSFERDAKHVWFGASEAGGADPDTFQFLDKDYAKDTSNIYSLGWKSKKIEGGDAATFTVLGGGLAKDKAHVYFRAYGWDSDEFVTLVDVDAASFTALPKTSFAKDKNHVYYLLGLSGSNRPTIVEGADPSTFSAASGFYKDKNHIYVLHVRCCKEGYVPNVDTLAADVATFVSLGNNYYKDKSQVFLGNEVIPGADPATFRVLSDIKINKAFVGFSRDKDNLYLRVDRVPSLSPDQFKIFGDSRYVADVDSIAYLETGYPDYGPTMIKAVHSIASADRSTFEYLGGGYAKDANITYYEGEVIAGVDTDSFTYLGEARGEGEIYGKDALHLYRQKSVIPFPTVANGTSNGDLPSLVFLGGFYAKDKNNGYYIGPRRGANAPGDVQILFANEVVNGFVNLGVDHRTFHLIDMSAESDGSYRRYAADSQRVLFMGVPIVLADPLTFKTYDNDDYTRDKSHVFYGAAVVDGADPNTFETEKDNRLRGKDATYEYSGGVREKLRTD